MRNRSQLVLPMELGIKIAENDPVRKLVEICEELDYSKLYAKYVRKWRKVSPETLFELVVFGYMQRRFSTRQIEEACRTDIRFMWILQGEPVPDHSTIDRFLCKRLTNVIEDLFYQLVDRLCVLGEVRYRNMFVDGTKLEANANRYTFVWKKAIEKNLKKLEAKGYVTRTRSHKDERNLIVGVTETGMTLRDKALAIPEAIKVQTRMSYEEMKTLYDLLYRMLECLDTIEE